ncbi:MAG: hypothetical protein QM753_05370 [Thermomicrobiales bacterium]
MSTPCSSTVEGHPRSGRALLILLLTIVVVVAGGGVPVAVAQETPVASTPVPDATPVPQPQTGAGPKGTLARGFGGTSVTPAEQELADKYAPIAMLKKQLKPCDPSGEQYLPIAVDVSLNDPDVKLRRDAGPDEKEDPVIMTGPSAQDLVHSDASYYLDLPGNSLDPGCTYETWSNKRIAELGLVPSTYARVVREEGRPGQLALQYFFYWVYNDFLDDHESDWEMVQLIFDADTPEEALTQDPVMITFAQHERGENATWEEAKAQFDGNHIVTYPASGSHADYFSSDVWLGWGENGAGFGCDRSNPESVATPLKAIVVPTEIDPDGPFAWALFQGRWGERQSWVLDGPKSPNITARWTRPISWTDDLRAKSLPIPHQRVIGLGPSSFFCTVSDLGGDVLKIFPDYPRLVEAGVIAVLIGLFAVSFLTWRFFVQAVGIFFRHIHAFALSCLLLIPVAAVASVVQDFLTRWTISSDLLSDVSRSHSVVGFGIGFVFHLFLLALVAPGIILATRMVLSGEAVHATAPIREGLPFVPRIVGAVLLNALILTLLSLTVVGIPFAFYRATQWVYTPQAVLFEGAPWTRAREVSRRSVDGDWPRTLSIAVLITYAVGVPGPLLGILLVLAGVSIPVAGFVSSAMFIVLYPITIITATLYYGDRRAAKGMPSGMEAVNPGLEGPAPMPGWTASSAHPA